MMVVIKFGIGGTLRFLSHAEMLKVFQRACVRAGIELEYSHGYNPRPRLSLPLPRSVGVETDEDLLCLGVKAGPGLDSPSSPSTVSFDAEVFKGRLFAQLPKGCRLIEVAPAQPGASFEPCLAAYVFTVRRPDPDGRLLNQDLGARIEQLLAGRSLNLQRCPAGKSDVRNVDVRPFLKSIELKDRVITVECRITSAGSVRVDEVLELLGLDIKDLAAPVRRTEVRWKQKPPTEAPN